MFLRPDLRPKNWRASQGRVEPPEGRSLSGRESRGREPRSQVSTGHSRRAVPPFSPTCRAMRLYVGRVDHLRVGGSPVTGKFAEQVFPDAALRPAHETVIDGCGRTVFRRTITPAAATLENMNDPADNAAVVRPINPTHVRGQMRLDPSPLLIVQPKGC